MYEFLTLAITEGNPLVGNFFVVAMETKSKKFVKFDFKKDQIISMSGQVYWDIGFATRVQNVIKNNNKNYEVSGFIDISNRKEELKKIFDVQSMHPEIFFNNTDIDFSIVKVKKVLDMKIEIDKKNYKSAVFKCRLRILINKLPKEKNNKLILNKDYRWIKYWKRIYETDSFSDKKTQYVKLLNDPNKSLYLILYRMKFKDIPQYWIVGMHWL